MIVGEEAAMLDAVAPVRVRLRGERLLVSREHLLDRRIADGMDRHLVALAMVVHHEFVQRRVGLALDADRSILAQIWLRHPGVRPPALPSVKIFTGPTRSISWPVPVTRPAR